MAKRFRAPASSTRIRPENLRPDQAPIANIVAGQFWDGLQTSIRFYIMPIQVVVVNETKHRGPMYLEWRWGAGDDGHSGGLDVRWSLKDYGLIAACLIAADVTPEQHQQLAAKTDVATPPQNIDQFISAAAIPQVKATLEALRIPADWVTTAYTYRQILRMIGGLFLFAQRYHGMHNEQLIDSAEQLDLRWDQIPSARQLRIIATADNLGYDYSSVQPTWLVRRILKYLGDQWGTQPIYFGFVTL